MTYIGPGSMVERYYERASVITSDGAVVLGPVVPDAAAASQLEAYFKAFGKFIWMYQQGSARAEVYRKALMALIAQGEGVDATAYRTYQTVMQPLVQRLTTMVGQLALDPAVNRRVLTDYLRKIVRPDYSSDATTPVRTIVAFIVDAMPAANMHVAAGGAFDTFFTTEFAASLPTSGTPEIPDSWVTDDIVE